jgi:hypothetical protein
VGLAGLKESHEQSASVINTRPDGRRTGDGGNLRQYFAALHMRKTAYGADPRHVGQHHEGRRRERGPAGRNVRRVPDGFRVKRCHQPCATKPVPARTADRKAA